VLDQIKGGVHSINSAMGAEGDLERFQLSVRQIATIAENEATRPGRKLLIWVGPGWPMLNGNNFSFSEKDQRQYFDTIVELTNKLREARVAVYSVAPENVQAKDRAASCTRTFSRACCPAKSRYRQPSAEGTCAA